MTQSIRLQVTLLAFATFALTAMAAPAFGQNNPSTPPKTGSEPAAKPSLKVDPTELQFGEQSVGSTSPVQTVTFTVDPPQDSSMKFTATVTGDFSVTPSNCDLKGSGKCAFSVSFAPKSDGLANSALTIATTSDLAN